MTGKVTVQQITRVGIEPDGDPAEILHSKLTKSGYRVEYLRSQLRSELQEVLLMYHDDSNDGESITQWLDRKELKFELSFELEMAVQNEMPNRID